MALSYPVFFSAPRNAELLPVIVLGIEDRSGGDVEEDGGSESSNSRQLPPKRVGRIERQVRTNGLMKTEQQENHNNVVSDFTDIMTASEGVAAVSNQKSEGELEAGSAGLADHGKDVADGAGNAGSAGGTGHGTGGTGYGNGNGTGSGNIRAKRVAVSYAYSPKPEYPESARREGREGTVVRGDLLRVGLQNLPLGARQVVLGQLADLLEELRALLVVEEPARDRARGVGEARKHSTSEFLGRGRELRVVGVGGIGGAYAGDLSLGVADPARIGGIGRVWQLRRDPQVRLWRSPATGEFLLRGFIRQRRNDDHIVAVFLIHGSRNTVLRGQLQ